MSIVTVSTWKTTRLSFSIFGINEVYWYRDRNSKLIIGVERIIKEQHDMYRIIFLGIMTE